MPFSYRELFCGGKTFCCCLPVRMGVIIMSFLGIIFGGVLSIVLWFEVSSTVDMTSGDHAVFVIAGLVESFLFVASILGFVGAIVRKQVFVQIYAYFIYVHFLLNIGVAAYLLYLVTHFSSTAVVKACQEAIQNQQTKDQCTGLLKVARGVYVVMATIVLLIELYAVLIVTRYVNQVKNEKQTARSSRLYNEEAFSLVAMGKGRYSALPSSHDLPLPSSYTADLGEEFDPYDGIPEPTRDIQRSSADGEASSHLDTVGYGGGTWTHSEISSEEKARLKERDSEMYQREQEEQDYIRNEILDSTTRTSPHPFSTGGQALESLPRYTLPDPPRSTPTL